MLFIQPIRKRVKAVETDMFSYFSYLLWSRFYRIMKQFGANSEKIPTLHQIPILGVKLRRIPDERKRLRQYLRLTVF
jgi:hypothetical protein